MALPVNTNIASLNAQRNLQGSSLRLNKALERLSSGLRINRAGDDAAGLAISEGLRSQIRGLNQAVRNAGDGLSLIGTAESSIGSYTEMLQRIRELAIQSANDTNSVANRTALDQEAQQLLEEMQRIASTVEFNGTKLLDGTFVAKQLQVGAQGGQTITIDTGNLQTSVIGQTAEQLGAAVNLAADPNDTDIAINGVFITDFATYTDTVSSTLAVRSAITIAAAINAKTNLHNVTAEVEATSLNGGNAIAGGNIDPSTAQLKINGIDIFDSITTVLADDADGALRNAINLKSNQTGVTATLDSSDQIVLTAIDGRNINVSSGAATIADELGFAATDTAIAATVGGKIRIRSHDDIVVSGSTPALAGFGTTTYFKNPNLAINNLTISTVNGANLAIQQIDNALEQVNAMRAKLGAITNRLEYTIQSLQTVSENLSASDSRIRDADFAHETAELTKNQILQQAGVAILGQANTSTQAALQLLPR
jgi:flagellin